MHFDDRLATVLRLRAGGAFAARTQYRQLLDLLGTLPPEARSDQIDAAYFRMTELSASIPAIERATMLENSGLRLRAPRLVAALAESEPAVAIAAISRADLSEIEWLDLIPALPVRARGFARHRRDLGDRVEHLLYRLGIRDRGLPAANDDDTFIKAAEATVNAPTVAAPWEEEVYIPEAAADEVIDLTTEWEEAANSSIPQETARQNENRDGIRALVQRIEAFRRTRQNAEAPASGITSPQSVDGYPNNCEVPVVQAFDFTTDVQSRINWADPGVAPMTVGFALAGQDSDGPLMAEPEITTAFRRRQPIRGKMITLIAAPSVAGDWQVDAAPWFDPLAGRFLGYRGRMRRPAHSPAPVVKVVEKDSEGDRIRQLLHELRTPVNAIQGFAEVIQQQLFGPTPHEYRALAASIASDGARMLAGFDELDRLAKLGTGAIEMERGECDLGEIVAAVVNQLESFTRPRNSSFTIKADQSPLPIPLALAEAERMTWRLLATLAGASHPGEHLRLRLRVRNGEVRLTATLPIMLAALDDETLFRATADTVPQALSATMFGAGFALRLTSAEARAVGGNLERREGKLRLRLPSLNVAPQHSFGDRQPSS